MAQQEITVRQASVVLASPSPVDPQTIRSDVLVRGNVVPQDWQQANQISTPVLAVTQFQNGISVQTEGNRCVFQEPVNGQLKDPYVVHGVARQYLEATKLVQYNAVGINWMLAANQVESAEWYRRHFSGSGDFSEYSPVSLQMQRNVGMMVCNLQFRFAHPSGSLEVECNFHFALSNSLTPLAALDHWRYCQNLMRNEIFPLLR